jgi:hypothetical protein
MFGDSEVKAMVAMIGGDHSRRNTCGNWVAFP